MEPEVINLRVGLPSGQVEKLQFPSSSPLSALVEKVRASASLDPAKTRIRLISAGRLLSDFSASIGSAVSDDDFIHVAVSEAISESPPLDSSSPGSPIHPAIVITTNAPDTGSEVRIILEDLGDRATQRLTDAGFTHSEASTLTVQLRRVRAEMAEMRASSRDSRLRNSARDRVDSSGEETAAFTIASSVEGSNTDFLLGCVCGYLLGVLVLAMLLDKNITRRFRVGIVAGVSVNLAFGVLHSTLRVHPF